MIKKLKGPLNGLATLAVLAVCIFSFLYALDRAAAKQELKRRPSVALSGCGLAERHNTSFVGEFVFHVTGTNQAESGNGSCQSR